MTEEVKTALRQFVVWTTCILLIAACAARAGEPAPPAKAVGGTQVYDGRSLDEWIAALKAEDAKVRIQAAVALGKIGPAAGPAVDALGEIFLKDPEFAVSHQASLSLARIGKEGVPPLLKALLAKKDPAHWQAIRALGEMGPPAREAQDEIRKRMLPDGKDGQSWLRLDAALAMVRIEPNSPDAITYLVRVLRGDLHYGTEVVKRDGNLHPIVTSQQDLHSRQEWAGKALAKLGKPAVGPLGDGLKFDKRPNPLESQAGAILGWPYTAGSIAWTLGLIGPEAGEAVPAMLAYLRDFRSESSGPDGTEEFVRAFVKIGQPAVKPLRAAASLPRGGRDEHARAVAIEALSQMPLEEPGPAILLKERIALKHPNHINGVAFSPDGQTLAVTSNRKVVLWDVKTGEEIATLTADRAYFRGVAFSPNGTLLAAAGTFSREKADSDSRDTGVVKIWDVAKRQEVQTFLGRGFNEDWTGLEFSPKGNVLAIAARSKNAEKGMAYLWDVAKGSQLNVLKDPKDGIRAASFTPDGKGLVTASRGGLKFWNVAGGTEEKSLAFHQRFLSLSGPTMALSRDGSMVATAPVEMPTGQTHALALVEYPSGKQVRVLSQEKHFSPHALAFSPDGKVLASERGRAVRLWDTGTGKMVGSYEVHAADITCVVFSSDGKALASGSADGSVRLWDVIVARAGATEKDPPKKEARDKPYLFRLQAAKEIADENARAEAIRGVARDAAEQALAGVVAQCVAALPEARKADVIAQLAPLLAESGQEAAALKLTESIADASARDAVLAVLAKGPLSGMTPLMRAAAKGFTDVVVELLDKKADVNEASIKPVKLAEKFPVDTHEVLRTGPTLQKEVTALMLAATNGHADTVKALLDRGADLNARTDPSQLTALMLACMNGRKSAVEVLLQRGPDLNAKSTTFYDVNGRKSERKLSAVVWASAGDHPEIVTLMLDKGALMADVMSHAKVYRKGILQLIEGRVPKKALTPEESLKESLKEDRNKLRGLWEAPGKLLFLGGGDSGTSVIVTALNEKGAIDKVGSFVWSGFQEKDGKRYFELLNDPQPKIDVEYRWKGESLELTGGVILEGGRVVGLTGAWRRSPKK